jgi:peptidoglycan/LPS O-acetylase OafA/YrhL
MECHFLSKEGLDRRWYTVYRDHFGSDASRDPEGLGHPDGISVQCFFAISGFLITTLLLRETERTGGVSLGGFYRRCALRIFPACIWLPGECG